MTDISNNLLHRHTSVFGELSSSNLEILVGAATKTQLKKGEFVLSEGQICKSIWFVEKGYLRTFFNKDGAEINIDFAFEGKFMSNLKSLRSGIASDTTIQAEEPTTVYMFDKLKLQELYTVSAEIESFARKILEHLLIDQEEHMTLFKIYSPKERYQYLQTNKPEILQRVSLSQLASYLGVARETLSRIRKERS